METHVALIRLVTNATAFGAAVWWRVPSAVRFGMSERIAMDVECPNGHNVGVDFTQEEFEEKLAAGEFEFHCNTCDTNWTPTKAEIESIRKGFAKT